MRALALSKLLFLGLSGAVLHTPLYAGIPVWTFSAPSPASVTPSAGTTETIQYTVTNQSMRAKNLVLRATPGLQASSCYLSGKGSSCNLVLTVNGSQIPQGGIHAGPILCEQGNLNQCYQPSSGHELNINSTHATNLQSSVNELALSVKGLTEYGVTGTPVSGVARVITIKNTGDVPALNLAVTAPTWPAGTTHTTDCGDTLVAKSSCTVTINPGTTASSDGSNPCSNGTAPAPSTIQVGADNANTVVVAIAVLNYGCIYQGGYLYAFDDTTAITGNVGGKVVALTDQASPSTTTGIVWSSDGSTPVFDSIYGISETSTTTAADPASGNVPGQQACNGATDGACDTNNIVVYYQNNAAGAPVNLSLYAAGLCKQSINGYVDWYLPAICEMGYDIVASSGCGTPSAPTLQNMLSNLIDFNSLNLLAGDYWSSTEFSAVPSISAWAQEFAPSGTTNLQSDAGKSVQRGVRCARVF